MELNGQPIELADPVGSRRIEEPALTAVVA
jgi:hypothetical protein